MYKPIKIERISEDKLTGKKWGFILFENSLVFDSYMEFERKTPRSKEITTIQYQRIKMGNFNGKELSEEEAPFPDDIKQEALQKLIDQLKVVTWSEYKS